MKTAGAPCFESSFVPPGGQEHGRDADRFPIPDAATHRIHIPRLFAENLQIALIRLDSPGLSPMQTPFRSPVSALRSHKIGFDPVGPTAKPSAVKTDKITLIALIWFDSVGPAAEPSTIKADKITLITLIGFDPVGPAARPSVVKTDKNTLIALIWFDRVGLTADGSTGKSDKNTLIRSD